MCDWCRYRRSWHREIEEQCLSSCELKVSLAFECLRLGQACTGHGECIYPDAACRYLWNKFKLEWFIQPAGIERAFDNSHRDNSEYWSIWFSGDSMARFMWCTTRNIYLSRCRIFHLVNSELGFPSLGHTRIDLLCCHYNSFATDICQPGENRGVDFRIIIWVSRNCHWTLR